MKICEKLWHKVIVVAPAQIGNMFGFFDRAGALCSEPPSNGTSRTGGPGDLIMIEKIPSDQFDVVVQYWMRGCDNEGYWEDIEAFQELVEDIKNNPDKELVRYLVQTTLRTMKEIGSLDEIYLDGWSLKITIIKHCPNKQVGLGLGSSACSTAIVIALDYLLGEPLRKKEETLFQESGIHPYFRANLMAQGEEKVSGAIFFDNVAPLCIEGGLIYIDYLPNQSLQLSSLPWPDGLFFVTITPDFSLETRMMRNHLLGKTIDCKMASDAAQRRADVMQGLCTGDIERIIRFAGDQIIEPLRWPLIRGHEKIRSHISSRQNQGGCYSLGIAGTGPTIYCLADSRGAADQIGQEIHEIWKKQGFNNWWFVHELNKHGARVIHVS